MNIAAILVLAQAVGAIEPLPIDERLALYEAVIPAIREVQAQVEADIGRLGGPESDWETSGMTAESAITAEMGGMTNHVLGEWEVGGHGVVIPEDRPLAIPGGFRRYSVREYSGRIDYHTYHRLESGIVLHSVGTVRRIGNAECQTTQGMEIISRESWRNWRAEIAFRVFSVIRMTRDDSRTYCIIYRPADRNRFWQLAYTPVGEPYIAANEDAQAFVVTSRDAAVSRMFD